MNQEVELSEFKNRKLSCFFARELFGLYLEEKMDKVRRIQVEEHLSSCQDCKILIERLKVSKKILIDLGQTQATAEVVEYLKKEHHFWEEFFERVGLTQSLSTVKWAIQLSAVGLALVITVHTFPWLNMARSIKKMRPATTRMAEQKKSENMAQDEVQQGVDGELPPQSKIWHRAGNQTVPGFIGPPTAEQAQNLSKKDFEVSQNQDAQKNLSGQSGESSSKMAGVNQSTTFEGSDDVGSSALIARALKPPVPYKENVPPQPVGSAVSQETRDEQFNDDVEGQTGKGMAGYVFRGSLQVDDVTDELAEKVTKLITDLGGKKAGQVELGWHRGKQRYYHFIIPDENYEKLLSDLNSEGFVQLIRERHPRVIKKGYNRVILTIEQEE